MDHTVTRDQIAHYVGDAFAVTWASRAQLLRTAYDNNAPHEVTTALVDLPERFFESLDEVCASLPRLAETGDPRR